MPLNPTRHFSVDEISRANHGDVVPPEYIDNVNATLAWLDNARDYLGSPIVITNLWRSFSTQAELASEGYSVAKNSEHKIGLGADIVVADLEPYDAANKLYNGIKTGALPALHQLIVYESPDNHIHIGLAGGSFAADMQLLLHTSANEYVAITAGWLEKAGNAMANAIGSSPAKTALITLGVAIVFFFPATSETPNLKLRVF